ncbi:hypothetical protein BGZ65_004280 [Modicella reniformis]|uniref:DNA-3-methyladenine glycosylase I n=1 Tax=Modicella reniformis TaxID=1440133 RepID=A0A9P6SMB0_9FUNG|nr:hypothetical protein BGZ65_004280 [Modicella reniformis]
MTRRSSRIAAAVVNSPTTTSAAASTTTKKQTIKRTTIADTNVNVNATEEEEEEEEKVAVSTRQKKRKISFSAITTTITSHVNKKEPMNGDGKSRCIWASSARHLSLYHDTEWCVPGGFNRTNRYLFEMIILEGAQAGLSWSTVLHKREAYREAYDDFDYNWIADTYTSPASNDRLLKTDIIKNKLKVEASITNAKAFRDLLRELYPDQAQPEDENGFWQFLQAYRKKQTKKNKAEPQTYLTSSEASDRLSADLKKRGFKFVGTTILYSYLQAVGIELDGIQHASDCFKHPNNAQHT